MFLMGRYGEGFSASGKAPAMVEEPILLLLDLIDGVSVDAVEESTEVKARSMTFFSRNLLQ